MDQIGVLTFDEFMMVYILLQRGVNVPTNRWQQAINSMPPGVISRPGLLNSAEGYRLLQYVGQFYQIPNFDPIALHNVIWTQLIPQVDPSGYIPQAEYLRVLSNQSQIRPYIW